MLADGLALIKMKLLFLASTFQYSPKSFTTRLDINVTALQRLCREGGRFHGSLASVKPRDSPSELGRFVMLNTVDTDTAADGTRTGTPQSRGGHVRPRPHKKPIALPNHR